MTKLYTMHYIGEISDSFEIKTGLGQGDSLSPVIFNLALEQIIKVMKDYRSMELQLGTELYYADDIVILGESQDQKISSTLKLVEASQRIGLKINEDKTKYMIMTRRLINKQNINIGQYTFERTGE